MVNVTRSTVSKRPLSPISENATFSSPRKREKLAKDATITRAVDDNKSSSDVTSGDDTESSALSNAPDDQHSTLPEDASAVHGTVLQPVNRAADETKPLPRDVIVCETRGYFDDALVARLNAISSLCDEAASVCPFKRARLSQLSWPTASFAGFGRSDILMFGNRHAVLTCVAELGHNGIIPRQGEARDRANITFKPLVPDDHDMAAKILSLKSYPVKADMVEVEAFWAMRFQSSKGNTTQSPFSEVYDGRRTFTTKRQMQKYAAGELEKGDIVFVEVKVTRWTPKDPNDSANTNRHGWTRWIAQFQLQSLTLLYKGSVHEPADTPFSFDVSL
ncbi:hypothetical protein PsYK624_133240 [Phanerochaete sordida]|uniref:Uncharacterized protein n=1 Tax=Phanerochaete sordida TaxID=48140 RepID=A0A9P3GJM1_9APHY|nr:hypothetical protein PsYK624_133240 [Phanerochaete sordida]